MKKKDVVKWPLFWTVAAGLMTWWIAAQETPMDNPTIVPLGIVVFGLWAIISFAILVKNIYQAERDDLPSWIRWAQMKRFWFSVTLISILFFAWKLFFSTGNAKMTIMAIFVSAAILLVSLWRGCIHIGESIPPPMN